MVQTRSLMLAALAGVCIPHVLYAAPKGGGAGKPALETGKPVPEQVAQTPQSAGAAAFANSFKFALEDDVPLPVKRVGVKGESAYPFAVMNVNQSFFVPATDKIKEPWKTLTSMASRMSRELHPKKFITAREKTKDGQDGVRIWRAVDSTEPLQPPRKKPAKAADKPAEGAAAGAADPFAGGQQAAA